MSGGRFRIGQRVRVTGGWPAVRGKVGTVIQFDPGSGHPIRVQLDGWKRAYWFHPDELQPEEANSRGSGDVAETRK